LVTHCNLVLKGLPAGRIFDVHNNFKYVPYQVTRVVS